jgi:MinD-like ATPase involved in chromosome partitioning or flagellar assembly
MTEQQADQQTVRATITTTAGKWSGNLAIGNQEYDIEGRDRNSLYSAVITRAMEIAQREDKTVVARIDDHAKNLVEVVSITPDGGVKREETFQLEEPEPAAHEPILTRAEAPVIIGERRAGKTTPGMQEYLASIKELPPLEEPPALPPAGSYETASFGQRPRASQGAVVAQEGFNGAMNRMTGGMLRLPASRAEARRARQIEILQSAPMATRAFINSKGGGGKTTGLYCTAATIGLNTPHSILALDGNDNHGTLGDRGRRMAHDATVRDVLTAVDAFAQQHPGAPVPLSLIAPFLHAQPEGFSVLPSQSRAYDTQVLTAPELHRLYNLISPSFSHIFIDTGNNIEGDQTTSTIRVAAEVADSYVFTMMGKVDNARNAFATMDYLNRAGFGDKVRKSVAIVAQTHTTAKEDLDEIVAFLKGRVSAHVIVPWDAELDRGRDIRFDRLAPATRHAYLDASVAILDPASHHRRP